jgi:LysM repeat protein
MTAMPRRFHRLSPFIVVLAAAAMLLGVATPTAQAALQCPPSGTHTIQPGEALSGIAARYGVSEADLAQANGITNPNLIYAGKVLVIPGCGAPSAAPVASAGQGVHVVAPGETLSSIAAQNGTTVEAIAQANGIANPNAIYVGERLVIPAGGAGGVAMSPAGSGGDKRIEVNLSQQMMYAYENGVLVLSSGVSTGRPGWDTPPGNFAIYAKYDLQTMTGTASGESWVVPNVPHVMYFYYGDALHGTYWHNAFGTGARLSHGCVNLPLDVAAQLYYWAPIGTPVWVHY